MTFRSALSAPARAGALLVAALAASALVMGGASASAAVPASAAVDQPEVRWAVTPSDPTGPDGRTAVEHTLDPGEVIEDRIAVRNVSDVDVVFRLTAADGFFSRTGRFDILPTGEESVAAGTWIEIPESVAVAAGQTAVVPFQVAVPERAEPGDHAAGITASILSVESAEDGTSVGVESRVGVRVLTRVTGEVTPSASLRALTGAYTTSWNPFRPGELTVEFEVVNDGNTRLLVTGDAGATGQSAAFPAEGENRQELLPGDARQFVAVVDGVWPLFLVPATVQVRADVLALDGSADDTVTVSEEILVWAVPWPQLALLLGIAMVAAALLWGRRRSRRRLDGLLDAAREEGRQAALTTPGAR